MVNQEPRLLLSCGSSLPQVLGDCIQSECEKRKRGNCATRFSTHIPLAKAQSLEHTGLYGMLRFAVSMWEEEKIGLLISYQSCHSFSQQTYDILIYFLFPSWLTSMVGFCDICLGKHQKGKSKSLESDTLACLLAVCLWVKYLTSQTISFFICPNDWIGNVLYIRIAEVKSTDHKVSLPGFESWLCPLFAG